MQFTVSLILVNGLFVFYLSKHFNMRKIENKIRDKQLNSRVVFKGKKSLFLLAVFTINVFNILSNGWDIVYILLINLCMAYCYWINKNAKVEKNDKGMIKDIYRMQRYLCHQYFSGSRIEDGLKEVYKLAESRQLYEAFLNLSITLTQTSSIEQSMMCLKKFERDEEIRLLIQSIEMMHQSSNHKLSLEKTNRLLYKKYHYYLDKEVENCKFKGMMLVTLYGILIIVILGVPLIMEAIQASSEIFI